MTLIEYVPTTVTFTAIPSDDGKPSSTEPTPEPSSNSQDEYSSDSETNGDDDGSDEVIPGLPLSWPTLIAILVIVLIILIVLGYLFYRWRKKRQAEDGAPAYFTDRQPSYVSQRSYRGYSGYSGNSNYGPGAGYTGIAGNIAKNGYGRGVDDPRFTMNTNNSRYKVSPRYTDNMYSNNPKSARHKTNATGTTSRSYWPTPARNTTWSMNTSQISDFGENQRNEYSKYDDYFGDNQNGYDSPHQSTRGWFGKTFGKLFGR
ncbi:hypothetical protein H4S00_000900 [Coemansia sp. D1744]|nr:hypothetical protein H4S00_000900 [Coemansia sp. D1744]